MKKSFLFTAVISLAVTFSAQAETKTALAAKAIKAAAVLAEMNVRPEQAVPHSLLQRAVCIATFPDLLRAGFILGATYGKGLISCRLNDEWSAPAFVSIGGVSGGFQIGAEATDVILIFTNPDAARQLSQADFTLDGDLGVAAGPVGQDAKAGTDYELASEIFSYSHSRGLFAGLTLNGSYYSVDYEANSLLYGDARAAEILTRSLNWWSGPHELAPYVQALKKYVR